MESVISVDEFTVEIVVPEANPVVGKRSAAPTVAPVVDVIPVIAPDPFVAVPVSVSTATLGVVTPVNHNGALRFAE